MLHVLNVHITRGHEEVILEARNIGERGANVIIVRCTSWVPLVPAIELQALKIRGFDQSK